MPLFMLIHTNCFEMILSVVLGPGWDIVCTVSKDGSPEFFRNVWTQFWYSEIAGQKQMALWNVLLCRSSTMVDESSNNDASSGSDCCSLTMFLYGMEKRTEISEIHNRSVEMFSPRMWQMLVVNFLMKLSCWHCLELAFARFCWKAFLSGWWSI